METFPLLNIFLNITTYKFIILRIGKNGWGKNVKILLFPAELNDGLDSYSDFKIIIFKFLEANQIFIFDYSSYFSRDFSVKLFLFTRSALQTL